MDAIADVGVFGGSGFYSLLDGVTTVTVDTPYGEPAAPLHVGDIGGCRVAFLPRHGVDHSLPPHRINYRANVWAMRQAGVRALIAPFAAGSLDPAIHPGDFVVCDQLVDRTWGRPDTYFDGPEINHISLADPYDPALGVALVKIGRRQGLVVHETGTVVVIQGPRFATRAESRWYRAQGWQVINMTQYPEAALAAELQIPYAGVALITDYDTGVEDDATVEPVSQEQVFAFFESNVDKVRQLLFTAVPELPLGS